MTDYLTVVEVLAMHDDQIERYSGAMVFAIRGFWKRRFSVRGQGTTPT